MSAITYGPLPALTRAARYLRSLDPGLPRSVWALQGGMLVNAFGNGVVLPFLVIYLHSVRGFSLSAAGLVVAVYGAVGLAGTTAAGVLADRAGPRRTLAYALLLQGAGYALLALVYAPWQAFVFMAVAGLGNGAFWPAQSALIVGHTPEQRRHAAFAVNRLVLNLGVGIGGVAGGLIATTSSPGSFQALFIVNAATFALFAALLLLVPALPRTPPTERRGAAGYRLVLRDRVFMSFVALNALLVIAAMAQLEATLPVFAKEAAGMTERAIGVMFGINVAVIVLLQMPIVKLLAGRNRMRTLALMSLVWAACWLGALAAGTWLGGLAAAAAVTTAIAVFAVGECLHAPTQGGLLADLAKPELRGRYFALSTSSYAIGFTVGPALGGLALGASPVALWTLAAGACVLAAGFALALDRRLPEAVRRTPAA
jgi:MFS family permease